MQALGERVQRSQFKWRQPIIASIHTRPSTEFLSRLTIRGVIDVPKFGLSISSKYFMEDESAGGLEPIVRGLAAAGIRACELSAKHVEPPADVAVVRSVLDRHGVQARTIHPPIGETNLGALDEDQRQASVAEISACFEPFAALGGGAAIVHPSGSGVAPNRSLEWDEGNRAAHLDAFRRSLDELLRMAETLGIRLACENMPSHGRPRPGVQMEEVRAVIDGYPHEVGLCLDTGHAYMSGLDPAAEARIAGERLMALHLQDTDGVEDRHWMPGQGKVNWAQLYAALTTMGFDGAWTFEVHIEPAAAAAAARRVADGWVAGRFELGPRLASRPR